MIVWSVQICFTKFYGKVVGCHFLGYFSISIEIFLFYYAEIFLHWIVNFFFNRSCEFEFFLADYLYYLHHMQLGLGSQITYLPSWWWSKGGQITPLETDHLASFTALFFFALWARFKHGIFIHSTCDIESIPILPYTQFQVICGI